MDIGLILDAAVIGAPDLPGLARGFLETEASGLCAALDRAVVLARRVEGAPDLHITAAADALLTCLADTEENALGEESTFMVLAQVGAAGDHDQGRVGRPPEPARR